MAPRFYSLLLLSLSVLGRCQDRYETVEIEVDASKHDEQFFTYVTRPDIEAPRWESKVYDERALAEGHWFVCPYGIVDQTNNEAAYVGPNIYDSRDGELIWNGGQQMDHYNTFSFKVVQVGDDSMLSMLHPMESHGVLLNNKYRIQRHIRVGAKGETDNMHDFQIVDNGASALYLTTLNKEASLEDSKTIGYEGKCGVGFNGFVERDIESDNIKYEWSPEGHIQLNESYHYPEGEKELAEFNAEKKCTKGGLDYLHSNSIEKLPDGDYMLSGRSTYAIYKISAKTGEILWRLGGKMSDFTFEGAAHFTAQHDARCLSQNDTHMVVSVMDNANDLDEKIFSNPMSRGLVMLLDLENMSVTALKEYNHPGGEGAYATGRGNMQTLDNGNAFVSWKDDALHSEYSPDGTLIAEAQMPAGLKTYRSFKFKWTGHAQGYPDVHSQLHVDENGNMTTVVHVSWNGDTQVQLWKLVSTNAEGTDAKALNHTRRAGFETQITAPGYVPYIQLGAENGGGRDLGTTKPVKTLPPVGAFPEEEQNSATPSAMSEQIAKLVAQSRTITMMGGVLLGLFLAWFLPRFLRRGASFLPYRVRRLLPGGPEKKTWHEGVDGVLYQDEEEKISMNAREI